MYKKWIVIFFVLALAGIRYNFYDTDAQVAEIGIALGVISAILFIVMLYYHFKEKNKTRNA